MLIGQGWLCVLAMAVFSQPPAAVLPPDAKPAAATRAKHYVFHVQVVAVDEAGNETLVAKTKLQTPGEPAGVAVETTDGRRFELSAAVVGASAQLFSTRPNTFEPGLAVAIPKPAVPKNFAAKEAAAPQPSPNPSPLPLPPLSADRSPPLDAVGQAGSIPELALSEEDSSVGPAAFWKQKITLSVQNETRRNLVRKLRQVADVTIEIDRASELALKPVLDSTITFEADEVPLATIFSEAVLGREMASIEQGGAIVIGTPERIEAMKNAAQLIVTYPVAHLFITPGPTKEQLQQLAANVQQTVEKESWEVPGGATLRIFESTASLVVRQTRAGHVALESYLKSLPQQ